MVVDYGSYNITTYIGKKKEKKEKGKKKGKSKQYNINIITVILLLSNSFMEGKSSRIILQKRNKMAKRLLIRIIIYFLHS